MHKKRGIFIATAVLALAAVLFWASSGVTRADDQTGRLTPPEICSELTDPESTLSGMPRIWLQNLCGVTVEIGKTATAVTNQAVIQQALAVDVLVNDPTKDGGQASVQSTTSTTINQTTGTVCAAYIDAYHGQVENTGYIGFSRSIDGGATFDDKDHIDATKINYGNPSLVWRASDGNFYLSALLGGSDGVGIWQSTDDCQTFDFVATLDKRLDYGVDDMAIMAVDNNTSSSFYGRLYLVWYGEYDAIQFSASDDGLVWQSRITISSGIDYNYKARTPWLTVGPNGDLVVAWNKVIFPWDADWTYSIEGVRSTDGGGSFTPITSPITNAVMPRHAGTTCGYNQPGLLGGIGYYPAPPQITTGSDGVLHMVYAYDPDGYNAGDVVDVFYRRSLDNGTSWEPEIRLNDDVTLTDQFFPTISVNENGRVVATWYDRRNDPTNNYLFETFMRTSFDNGQTWETSVKISDAQSPVFVDPTIDTCYHGFYDQQFQDTDSAYIFWSDDRNLTNAVQDPDVFFEKVTFPADFVISATPASQAVCTSDSPVYDVNLASVSGYNNSVTLSVSGAPAGANAAFAANPVTPNAATTLTLSNLGGATAGSYSLGIVGTEGSKVHTATVALDLASAVPGSLTLSSPADTAVNVPVTTSFTWTPAAGAGEYTLEIATDSGFASVVYSETTTHITLMPSTYLAAGTLYYWRVTADNGCGSAVSATSSFTTAVSPMVLLVDDDDDGPDVRAFYTDALDAMGTAYDIWDTSAGLNLPVAADLAPYGMVIWFTGARYGAGPTEATEAMLSQWLPQDNCLFLSSPSYLNTITAFRSQFLGLRSYFSKYPEYANVTGDWVVYGGLGPYNLVYPYYADTRGLVLNGSGQPAFVEAVDTAGSSVYGRSFRSTYLGFPFEAIDLLADRQDVLTTALNWCSNGVLYGSLAGTVTDTDYSWPIKNASVTADDGSNQVVFTTDLLGNFSGDLRTGTYTVTVTAVHYASFTTQVTINDGATTPLDANLQGGSLGYTPPNIEDTVALGDVVTHTITLTASGSLPVDVSLTPYSTLLDRVYGIYASFDPQPTIAYFNRQDPATLTSLGSFAKGGSVGGDFFGDDFTVVYALGDLNDYDASNDELLKIDTTSGAVTVVGTLPQPPGWEQYSAMGYDPATQQMYVVSSYVDFFSTGGKSLFTIDVTTGQTTLLGAILSQNQLEIDSIAFDDQGTMYAHDTWGQQLLTIDKTTRQATAIGPVLPYTNFNGGMDWDPVTKQMYITTWNNDGGQLHTIDLATAETTFVESLGSTAPGNFSEIAFTWIAFASAPLPWATAVPDQITIPANSSVNADVVFDTRGLYALEDYKGAVAFSGSFVNNVTAQPLLMHVPCADCGVLDGSILDDWFNTAVKANVTITSANGMNIHLVSVDAYNVTVPAGEYTLTAAAPGYLDATTTVTAVSATTVTTDIILTPQASFLSYSPANIDVNAQIGDLMTKTVTVSNTGTVPMRFTVRMDNFDVPIAVRNAALTAINEQSPNTTDAPLAITAYGILEEGIGGSLGWFNLNDSTNIFSSGQHIDHGSLRGGDFWANDFSTLYAFEESKLIALDAATGSKRIVGALPMISTYSVYDGMAYDPVTETMYILHAFNCYMGQSLYAVDVHTAATSQNVPIAGSGCLNSLTFADNGTLYSVDIDNDILVTIDPTTGQVTVVGSLGFDANTFTQGLAWDSATNQLFYTSTDPNTFPFTQKFYRINVTTGAAEYLSDMGFSSLSGLSIASEAVRWATLPTDEIVVPAGMQATFDIVFDLRSMVTTGDFLSDVVFEGGFINNPPDMPVSLALGCTDCATLDGRITDAATSDALPATLHITAPNGFDKLVHNKDAYNLTVQPGEYTITVSRRGFVSQVTSVTAVSNAATTTDFNLVPEIANIAHDPTAFNEVVTVGTTVTKSFTISNTGASAFDFAVRDTDWSLTMLPTVPYTSCGDADAFGYSCIDSNVPGSPVTYNWIDISTTGQSLGLSGANDFYAPLEIPFNFSYYGQEYNQLSIHSYGQVYFEDRQPDPTFAGNQPIPSTIDDGVQAYIAPLWDSHNYTAASKTYYEVQGIAPHRRLIIQWENIDSSGWPSSSMTFQVVLFENGNILSQYKSLNDFTGDRATIGIQGDPQTGLQYGYNQAVLSDELAVCFVHPSSNNYDCSLQPPDAPWLFALPDSGTVNANGSVTVDVVFDATAVTPGIYLGEIYYGGAFNAPLVIPVEMQVVNVSVDATPSEQLISLFETARYTVSIVNTGDFTDTFDLNVQANWDTRLLFGGRASDYGLSVTLAPQESVTFDVIVTPPANASGGSDTAVITAASQTYSGSYASVALKTTVKHMVLLPFMIRN
ncbi:MAG: carboxypeptidase regulatory-like domain-containing protein [Chloroflexi bacterium]|nr:carboxypeptidase regulatory-like domain-containing protein [Chloroflexota bacterium]MBP7042082.1 carboxypeptidase regulatory-like domain-containing protein [Chloroflexota bacterium]